MTIKIEEDKRPLVVLFGAGASHGARDGVKPPLGKDLIPHLLNVYNGLRDDRKGGFNSFFKKDEQKEAKELVEILQESASQGKDYEIFLSDYRNRIGIENFQNDKVIKVLSKLLSVSMVSFGLWEKLDPPLMDFPFFEKRDRYDELIEAVVLNKLKFNLKNTVFVTPNYDVLFEQALRRAELFQDPKRVLSWPETTSNDALLLKIHGSANWVGNMGEGVLRPNNPIPVGVQFTSNSRKYSNNGPKWNHGFDHLIDQENEVIMAHYAIDKPSHVNLDLIEHMRKKAIRYAKNCEEAILIGIHLEERREADPCLFEILTELRKCRERDVPVTYIGIPGTEAQKAENEFKFKVLTEGFSGFLKSLR